MTILHDIEKQRPWRELLDCPRGFLFGLEALQQANVGAPVAGSFEAGNAFVVAELLVGVRAGDELDVGLGGVDGGTGSADAGQEDVVCDNLFAGQMSAAFGQHLVFDVEGGDVGPDVMVDGLGDRYGTWVGSVISKMGAGRTSKGV